MDGTAALVVPCLAMVAGWRRLLLVVVRDRQTGEMKRAEATMESGNQDLAVTMAKQTADRHRTWSNGVHWIVANLQCGRKGEIQEDTWLSEDWKETLVFHLLSFWSDFQYRCQEMSATNLGQDTFFIYFYYSIFCPPSALYGINNCMQFICK
jgi:hypothetical protein